MRTRQLRRVRTPLRTITPLMRTPLRQSRQRTGGGGGELDPMTDQDQPAADDAIPYPLAAKALKVSRRTIERMIERGDLDRVVDATPASVTRRSVVAALERSGDTAEALTRQSSDSADSLPPVVERLLEQLTEAQEAAATATAKLMMLEAGSEDREQRAAERDQLLADLVTGSRRERRAARKAALKRLSGDL